MQAEFLGFGLETLFVKAFHKPVELPFVGGALDLGSSLSQFHGSHSFSTPTGIGIVKFSTSTHSVLRDAQH